MTDCERVLSILRAWKGDWVPNLYQVSGVMVHSRVSELRRRGYHIEMRRFGTKDYRYRLIEQEDA